LLSGSGAITRFEVGLDEDGRRVFYNVWDGTSETPPFLAGRFSRPEDGIVIVQFDSYGRYTSILNSEGHVLRTEALSDSSIFARGLFPDRKELIELSSGPNSEFELLRLLLLEPVE
jgi:hypothetical protein